MTAVMHLVDLLTNYEDGNDIGWHAELEWLWTEHADQMAALVQDIALHGIREPIMLGHDGSVWDGHHRIAAAVALMLDYVPVATPEEIHEKGQQS